MLILTRKKHESIIIDENITIEVLDIKGDHIKLGINAPQKVKIYRDEVYQAILKENRAAATTPMNMGQLQNVLSPLPPHNKND